MISSIMKMARIDWLLDRRKGIGGSDVAAIMGLNKWKSAYQIWLEKTEQVGLSESDSEPAYWGTVLEEVVAKEFAVRTGKKSVGVIKYLNIQNIHFLERILIVM